MPLSGGTSGAHDDSMHQGSAKRDVVDGVAGLDASGNLLSKGGRLYLSEVSGWIYLYERNFDEQVMFFVRGAPGAYNAFIQISTGTNKKIVHEGMKDVANGIAALDAAGNLLVPGSKMYYTRDGSDDVHIYERTSNEEAYAFHRVGADDYTFFVKESNVWKRMQTESMKDAVNGIAGLDAGGHVLAPGYRFTAARGAAEQITIRERTSDERAFRWIRIGANDYEARVNVGGVEKVVQHEGLKDVASGIAGLGVNGRIGENRVGGLLEKYIIGDADAHTHNGLAGTSAAAYSKVKQMAITTLYPTPSTIRILFQLHADAGTAVVYGRIYKNDVAVGTERSTASTSPQTYTEDLSFAQGDNLQIYGYAVGGGDSAMISDFIIRGTEHQQTLLEAIQQTDVGVVDPVIVTNS